MVSKSRFTNIQILSRLILFFTLAFLFWLMTPNVNGQEKGDKPFPKKVLFVGNSYTFVENMPHIVSAMAEEKGIPLIVQTSTAGGATLEDHWKGEKNLKTLQKIETGDFDAVILQDQSVRPILEPEKTINDIGLLCKYIRKNGAIPYLFLTWAREKIPQIQEELNKTYFQAAQNNNVKVVPVGPEWELARKLRPDIHLYSEDGSHPSKLGAYLSACLFFAILTDESPKGLTNNPTVSGKYGETIHLMSINNEDAEFCQRVAEQTINVYLSEHN